MRSHYCGLIDESLIGQRVTLCGWADVSRNLGGVCFIDLRDHEGIVQVVAEPENPAFIAASEVGYEDCLRITGSVRARHSVNDRLRSGKVEVLAERIEVLNKSDKLPFYSHETPGEDVRLKYRYLDLRNPVMQRTLRKRTALVTALRRYLDTRGFQDIETPILTKATPEGARDYLVPSRVHAGEFFALPQSPQLFKQLLMMAGFDRYYQIARCFRDEDLRADRQPEFTQLDIEFAFVSEHDVQDFVEAMIRQIFKDVQGVELAPAFPRLSYAEAMRRYGSDKPDLRIAMELRDIASVVQGCEFKVFAEWANHPQGRVAALSVPGGASLSRKQIDDYATYAGKYGAKGLAWMKVETRAKGRDGISSPIAKFLDDATLAAVLDAAQANDGDIVLFGAGPYKTVCDFMGALRLKLGRDLGLIENAWKPLWVTDFPMFEWDDEEKRYFALHHPFTAPSIDDVADLRANAHDAVSRGYDMVLNGNEIGGGSIRIHRSQMQSAVFDLLGIGAEEAQAKFGFLLEALRYGAPPHGGIAFGIDRIAALMAGTDSIRDVIAFPKTASAQCLLTSAPSPVADAQLRELHIRTEAE
ncbi:MAG: aspartate--tRNA ligase [Xanthomonadaceae bacterium]|nr:aspartate--tRNA ligase [Xanthomonadaceae bacterium]MDP2184845.1 aspartate--tRNA ligase [Xanthomonadales bacterium]MDZ4115059.1 aspartate--tRNA ligase [Xanthomonadaceae bacterium]MDZ4378125.1 aspartate--tRNA ligase [Xanthomonadaceae bacterium]